MCSAGGVAFFPCANLNFPLSSILMFVSLCFDLLFFLIFPLFLNNYPSIFSFCVFVFFFHAQATNFSSLFIFPVFSLFLQFFLKIQLFLMWNVVTFQNDFGHNWSNLVLAKHGLAKLRLGQTWSGQTWSRPAQAIRRLSRNGLSQNGSTRSVKGRNPDVFNPS